MKPSAFAWQRVESVEEALSAIGEDAQAKLVAGGQSLGPMLNLRLTRPTRLIDLRGITSLAGIDASGERVRIGAGVTHARIEDEAGRIEGIEPLAHSARGIAYRAIRTRGTVGGALAHADPAADWPLVFAALGAVFEIRSPQGSRIVDAASFMSGPYATALRRDEILVAIEVPRIGERARWVHRKFCRKPGEFATASACALFDPDRRVARVFVGAPASRPVALPGLARELALAGSAALTDTCLLKALTPHLEETTPDRRQAARVVLERALMEIL